MPQTVLTDFQNLLDQDNLISLLRDGQIGRDALVDGPFGPKPLIYADYVASGRALQQIETFIVEKILPYYSNSHTDASFCGSFCTQTRHSARRYIAEQLGATDDYSVLFTGAGATAGINRIISMLDLYKLVRDGKRVVVIVGPYEHHSNLLPWRETGADVIELPESENGGPDLQALKDTLDNYATADRLIGAFSAASNVTGIVTDVEAVSQILHKYGALSIWDFACAAPYLPMSLNADTDKSLDAMVFSTHKFLGGPAASGITVIRNAIAENKVPTWPGGGTVSYVSPWSHVYSDSLVHREEAGTPNVIGDIRAALVLMVKQALGVHWLENRQSQLRAKALAAWSINPLIELLGLTSPERCLPIFSFRVKDKTGGHVHHQLFTRLLSDVYGIQARGGCACAGSYAHRLLDIDKSYSQTLLDSLSSGNEADKPGWIRLNFSAMMSDSTVDKIISSVNALTQSVDQYQSYYTLNSHTARYEPISSQPPIGENFSVANLR